MEIRYYKVGSPAEAFDEASRDTKYWRFAEMDALAEMAQRFRDGFSPTMRLGSGKVCPCTQGSFMLFDDKLQDEGYGIGLQVLHGHEVGIDDDVAQEILDYHQDRLDQEFFADQLLVWADHVASLDDLDRGYAVLEETHLVERTGGAVTVSYDGKQHRRPAFIV